MKNKSFFPLLLKFLSHLTQRIKTLPKKVIYLFIAGAVIILLSALMFAWASPDQSSPSLIDVSVSKALTFSPEKGEKGRMSYTLARPSMVRIRIVSKEDSELVLRTLLDWKTQGEGEHILYWDGKDSSGNLINPRLTSILIATEPLRRPSSDTSPGKLHSQHPKTVCGDLKINLSFPEANAQLQGKVPIQGSVDKKAQGFGEGYDIIYYLDYQPIHYDYIKGTSFEWTLDTTKFSNGKHMLIISLCDRNDHRGSISIPIYINNPREEEEEK